MRMLALGAAALLAVVAGIAPAAAAQVASPPSAPGSLASLPQPSLDAMEPAARRRVEQVRGAVAELAGQPGRRAELAQAVAFLGQHYQAYDLGDAAESCYEVAHELQPESAPWLYLRGLARHTRGDLPGAVADYREAWRLEPAFAAAAIRLGDALLELGGAEEARTVFAALLERDAAFAAAHYGAGRAAAALGDVATAVRHLERALELQPDASAVHYPLAQAYRQLGDATRAEAHLGQRGDGRVAFPDPLGDGIARISTTTAFEVVEDLAADPGRFAEESFVGFVLSQLGAAAGAAEALAARLEQLDRDGAAAQLRGRLRYALGGLLLRSGRDEEAASQLARALELDPGLRDARLQLANSLARRQRFGEALAHYDRLVAAGPGDADVFIKRGAARANNGDLAGARADFEAAIAAAPNDGPQRAIAHTHLASLHRRAGEMRQAAAAYQQALTADPTHLPALSGFASLLGQLGRYREAAILYRDLADRQPDDVAARLGEATALILGGAHREARERLEAGLAALPDSLDLKDVLARHLAAAPDESVRDGPRAVVLAEALFDKVPTTESVETLAMAYAQAGRFADAVEWQQRLLRDAGEGAPAADRERWRRNLERYERHQSCCAAAAAAPGGLP